MTSRPPKNNFTSTAPKPPQPSHTVTAATAKPHWLQRPPCYNQSHREARSSFRVFPCLSVVRVCPCVSVVRVRPCVSVVRVGPCCSVVRVVPWSVVLVAMVSAGSVVVAAQDLIPGAPVPAPIAPAPPLPPPFSEWLTAFRAEAVERGIRPEVL